MDLQSLLGDDAESLLGHTCAGVPASSIIAPGPDFIDRVMVPTDRSPQVLRNLGALYNTGRLGGTGYLSILPVDQGIEHSAAASFAPNPAYFDPANICELAIEGGCNAVATTYGVLGAVSRRYAHRIPFIVKVNHNELMTYPNTFDQVMFGSVQQAYDLGASGIGATIYFGSEQATRQIQEVSAAFAEAHSNISSNVPSDRARKRIVGFGLVRFASCSVRRCSWISLRKACALPGLGRYAAITVSVRSGMRSAVLILVAPNVSFWGQLIIAQRRALEPVCCGDRVPPRSSCDVKDFAAPEGRNPVERRSLARSGYQRGTIRWWYA